MNNAYFTKNQKLQTRNRAGMIRSYRTTRTFSETLILIIDIILGVFDRMLDVLVRPSVHRIIRGMIAISCVAVFICLIAAVEAQLVSVFIAILLAVVLVAIEVLCLRGN